MITISVPAWFFWLLVAYVALACANGLLAIVIKVMAWRVQQLRINQAGRAS